MKKIAVTSLFLTILTLCCFAQGPAKAVPAAERYEGGQKAMYKLIEDNTVYPMMAKKNRIQGECIVAFKINADGTTSNHRVVKNIGGGCGEEALRVVKLLKFRPGYEQQVSV